MIAPKPAQQQTAAPQKITADHIIALTKNAKTTIANMTPVKDVAAPTSTAESMKDKILKKTQNKSPAEKMKAKILQKTIEKQIQPLQ